MGTDQNGCKEKGWQERYRNETNFRQHSDLENQINMPCLRYFSHGTRVVAIWVP